MWNKTEINTYREKGPQWDWIAKDKVSEPAIKKIFLCTIHNQYELIIGGSSAKLLFDQLSDKINPDYLKKGYLPLVRYNHINLIINLRGIMDDYGLAEVQAIVSIVYKHMDALVGDSFSPLQVEIDQYLCKEVYPHVLLRQAELDRRNLILEQARAALQSPPQVALESLLASLSTNPKMVLNHSIFSPKSPEPSKGELQAFIKYPIDSINSASLKVVEQKGMYKTTQLNGSFMIQYCPINTVSYQRYRQASVHTQMLAQAELSIESISHTHGVISIYDYNFAQYDDNVSNCWSIIFTTPEMALKCYQQLHAAEAKFRKLDIPGSLSPHQLALKQRELSELMHHDKQRLLIKRFPVFINALNILSSGQICPITEDLVEALHQFKEHGMPDTVYGLDLPPRSGAAAAGP